MDKIKYVKLENEDGTYSESIPFSTSANEIEMSNEKNVQETIGNIDVDNDGSVAYQLNNKINNIDIVDNLLY